MDNPDVSPEANVLTNPKNLAARQTVGTTKKEATTALTPPGFLLESEGGGRSLRIPGEVSGSKVYTKSFLPEDHDDLTMLMRRQWVDTESTQSRHGVSTPSDVMRVTTNSHRRL